MEAGLYVSGSPLLDITVYFRAMDSGKAVNLILLDFSETFDTIDYNIIFNCLSDRFGVDGTLLMWIKSYLTNHRQKVKFGNSFLDALSLPYGVPQGSVLGLLIFPLYTSSLSNIISSFNVTHYLNANDTQLYLSLEIRNFDSTIAEHTNCLACIQKWMVGVRLKLNQEPKHNSLSLATDRPGSLLCKNFPPSFL